MTYLLDSNTCIAILNGSSPKAVERLQRQSPATVFLCSVVKSELLYPRAS